jgi:hypothetical protein
MPKAAETTIEQKLDAIIALLQCIVARDLARSGVPQQAIAKHLKVATAVVGPLVKGVKKES